MLIFTSINLGILDFFIYVPRNYVSFCFYKIIFVNYNIKKVDKAITLLVK